MPDLDGFEDPDGAPVSYVANFRGVWGICDVCGLGLRSFPFFEKTRDNAIAHLDANHPDWNKETKGP